MSRILMIAAIVVFPLSQALAQEGPPRGPGPFGPPPPGDFRGGPRGPGGWGGFGARMWQRLGRELALDETQQSQYDAVVAAHQERMREVGRRWGEVRAAMEAGDEEQARTLREQLEKERVAGPDPFTEVFDGIEPILRPEQLDKLDDARDRMERDRGTWDRIRRITTEMPDALQLDETQRGQFQELVNKGREEFMQQMAQMRPLFEQMREADEAGDDARVEELRQQIEAARPDPEARFAEFFGQVDAFLREDQRALLADFRDDLGVAAPGEEGKAKALDVRAVLAAARRLRLAGEQKSTLREIEESAQRDLRAVRRDKEAQSALATRTQEQITRLLTPEQAQRFERLLERARGRR